MDNKLDKIASDIVDIKLVMERNTVSLEEHIRRTNILEQKMEPVERHVNMVNGAIKLISLAAAVSLAIAAIVELCIK